MQKAIFLDRDGVINSDIGHYYIYRPEDFVINKGIIPSLKKFSEAGYLLFIITNQGGVAKGEYTEEDIAKVHEKMLGIFASEEILIKKIYYCPHHDSIAPCKCRKPSPHMINVAIDTYQIDKEKSYMIGDSKRDIQAAQAAGIKGIKIEANEDISKYCDQILKGTI